MMRVSCAAAVLVALLGAGCSGGEEGTATPASPTPTTNAAGPQSPTNSSCVPAAPGNLRVAVSGSSRVFNWDAVNGATDYFIQIGSGSGGSDLVNTNTSQTTYSWTGQGPGTYYARVYARNSCGSGPNSTQITFN
jgi:hypothetical protein